MTPPMPERLAGEAAFRGIRATHPTRAAHLIDDAERITAGGFWAVVATFEGDMRAWGFERVMRGEEAPETARREAWHGPERGEWATSLDRLDYEAGVERIRSDIREGDVYQVNLCRVLSAPMTRPSLPDAVALSHVLSRGNPARHAARIVVENADGEPQVWVVSASPELYLRIDGDIITSAPIKGTAAPGERMLDKDEAENIMIADLIRNDLAHVAVPGSVAVPELLGIHDHPGLVHLQSTVTARLAPEFDWTAQMLPALLEGTFPPGSVSGAPKRAALDIIAREEAEPRGPYCGAIGWIDADRRQAELAVGIRTFWWSPTSGGRLCFGTGAGITWGSDASAEWLETELKARRLIALASSGTMTP